MAGSHGTAGVTSWWRTILETSRMPGCSVRRQKVQVEVLWPASTLLTAKRWSTLTSTEVNLWFEVPYICLHAIAHKRGLFCHRYWWQLNQYVCNICNLHSTAHSHWTNTVTLSFRNISIMWRPCVCCDPSDGQFLDVWIGLVGKDTNPTVFSWIDKTPITFTYWLPNQPVLPTEDPSCVLYSGKVCLCVHVGVNACILV